MKSVQRQENSIVEIGVFELIIFLTVVLFSVSCQKNEEHLSGTSVDKSSVSFLRQSEVLVREITSDPQNLNPVLSNDIISSWVEGLIFDSMLAIDGTEDSNIVGQLAENWDISENRLTFTFHLRKDVFWHDGHSFDAEDVKFTFDKILDESIPAIGLRAGVDPVKSIKIAGPFTIKVYLKYPYAPAFQSIGNIAILPEHLLNNKALANETMRRNFDIPVTFLTSEFNRNPVGTGPYKFVKWKTAQYLKLRKNFNYWDKENGPSITGITFKIIQSQAAAFNSLRKGELDVFRARPTQFLRFNRLESMQADYRGLKFYEPTYFFIGWNMRPGHRLFIDKRVRTALAHALDRKTFIEKALYGMGRIVSGPYYFKSWAYNLDIEPLSYDLQKAVTLLEEAGWRDSDNDGILDKNGVKFKFQIMIPASTDIAAQLVSIFQANLKKISIEMDIIQYEWSVFLSRLRKGEFEAVYSGWGLGTDPDNYGTWHSSMISGGNNHLGFRNKEVDTLLEQGRRTFEQEKREKIYYRIHEILHVEQPCIFIHTPMETYILSRRIKNVQVSPYGLFGVVPGELAWDLEALP